MFHIIVGDRLQCRVYFNLTAVLSLQRGHIFTSHKGPCCLWAWKNKGTWELAELQRKWSVCVCVWVVLNNMRRNRFTDLREILDFACLSENMMNVVICAFLECFTWFLCRDSHEVQNVFLLLMFMNTSEGLTSELLCFETGCVWLQLEVF